MEVAIPTLTPPSVEEAMGPIEGLFKYFKVHRGVALIVNGSTVVENRYPSQEDVDSADFAYLGGHSYTISSAEAATLTNAGYGAYIT